MQKKIPKIRLIQDILRMNVAERPNKVALICEKQRLTYAQIDAAANRLANALRENGVQDGDRVLFHLMNSSELVIGLFAALRAGAVFAVVDYANTHDTMYAIAADCEAVAVVTYAHQAEIVVRLLNEVPSLQFAILVGKYDDSMASNLLSFDTIQETYLSDILLQRRVDGDLAYLLYTSGSTGNPKGVMTTHRSCLFTTESGVERFSLTENDIYIIPVPLSFAFGINLTWQILWVGGTLILEQSFVFPVMTLKLMAAERVTGFGGVPTILALMLQMDLSRYDLSNLHYVISSGAALDPSLIEKIRQKLPQVTLFSMYGMAEASFALCMEPEQLDHHPTSVGKPFPGTQAWIVDEEGQRVGSNKVGELVIRGGHVRSGYWNEPNTSAERFRPGLLPGELVCFSGDLFRMDDDGYYYFVARSDEIIKSGARKVAPREIENALYRLDGILEAAVIGVPDPLLGQAIKACVVLDAQARRELSIQDILDHCHQTLEEFKVPREIEIRDLLPKTRSGKIIKTSLT